VPEGSAATVPSVLAPISAPDQEYLLLAIRRKYRCPACAFLVLDLPEKNFARSMAYSYQHQARTERRNYLVWPLDGGVYKSIFL
jgi:hypothetical protein